MPFYDLVLKQKKKKKNKRNQRIMMTSMKTER